MTPDPTLAVTNTCPKDGVHLWGTNMWKQNKAVNPPSRPSGTTGAPTQPEGQPPPAARKHSERDVAHIGPSVVIKGELHGNEDLTVDGVVEGTIVLREHVLTIGPHGRIKAQVLANSVVVLGEVTGDVTASELVDIREGGRWTAIWRRRAWPSPPARISAAASTYRRRRWPDLQAEKIGPRCPHNTRLNPSAPPEEALVPRDVGCCETCFTLFSAAVKEALRSWRERDLSCAVFGRRAGLRLGLCGGRRPSARGRLERPLRDCVRGAVCGLRGVAKQFLSAIYPDLTCPQWSYQFL